MYSSIYQPHDPYSSHISVEWPLSDGDPISPCKHSDSHRLGLCVIQRELPARGFWTKMFGDSAGIASKRILNQDVLWLSGDCQQEDFEPRCSVIQRGLPARGFWTKMFGDSAGIASKRILNKMLGILQRSNTFYFRKR